MLSDFTACLCIYYTADINGVSFSVWNCGLAVIAAMMTSRNARESLFGPRNVPVALGSLNHRRGLSLNGISNSRDSDDNLDLFSKNRRTLSVASSDESSDVSVKLGRLSVGSAKPAKSGIDDLLSSTEGGKHDYDWYILTTFSHSSPVKIFINLLALFFFLMAIVVMHGIPIDLEVFPKFTKLRNHTENQI